MQDLGQFVSINSFIPLLRQLQLLLQSLHQLGPLQVTMSIYLLRLKTRTFHDSQLLLLLLLFPYTFTLPTAELCLYAFTTVTMCSRTTTKSATATGGQYQYYTHCNLFECSSKYLIANGIVRGKISAE